MSLPGNRCMNQPTPTKLKPSRKAQPGPDPVDTSPWRLRFNAIHKDLREQIILLRYPPGMRLNVDELARQHQVSRTPIRTVLQRLENEGLAITRHGVGSTVTEIDFDHVRDDMLLRMHLAELIGTLKPLCPSEETMERLEQLRDQCTLTSNDASPQTFASIDMQLHDCKCSLIGNELLNQYYDELYYRTVRTWFHFLPRMDWAFEYASLAQDIELTRRALQRGDIAAVGFITRNAISDGLFRLADLIAEVELQ
jgi:DNA-binding GntR family transcriptional regulator